MHYIYITTNRKNGKKYIGQRKLPANKTIKTDEYLGSGTALLMAIEKHGKRWFSKEIISTHKNQKQTDLAEIELINLHDATDNDMFYNISGGGQFGRCEDHSEVISNIMKYYYNDDDNFLKAKIKSNRKRIKKGLKPIAYTIAERDINKLRKQFIKSNNIKQREYKRKIKRMVDKVESEKLKSIRNTKEYKNKVSERNKSIAVKSWETNRHDRLNSMNNTWSKKKDEGYSLKEDHKRKLAIKKLTDSGNDVGVWLINNGMNSISPVRSSLSKLISVEYKDPANFTKQLTSVLSKVNGLGYSVTYNELLKLSNSSRMKRGHTVYI